jgi:hypothetical protein
MVLPRVGLISHRIWQRDRQMETNTICPRARYILIILVISFTLCHTYVHTPQEVNDMPCMRWQTHPLYKLQVIANRYYSNLSDGLAHTAAQVVSYQLPTIVALLQGEEMFVVGQVFSRPNSGWCTKCAQSHPFPRSLKKIGSWTQVTWMDIILQCYVAVCLEDVFR